jgi:hypothetical protein
MRLFVSQANLQHLAGLSCKRECVQNPFRLSKFDCAPDALTMSYSLPRPLCGIDTNVSPPLPTSFPKRKILATIWY